MDGHTLTAPSDISAATRLAVLVRRTRQVRLRDGCGTWDTGVYRGTNQARTGLQGASLIKPVPSGGPESVAQVHHAPQGSHALVIVCIYPPDAGGKCTRCWPERQ